MEASPVESVVLFIVQFVIVINAVRETSAEARYVIDTSGGRWAYIGSTKISAPSKIRREQNMLNQCLSQ